MLHSARDYARTGDIERRTLRAAVRVRASSEALRVTTRLAHCLAWLMVQRAVVAGEISAEAAREPDRRLGGQGVCDDAQAEHDGELPPTLRGLLAQSRNIYQRLERLDSAVRN